MNSSKKNTYKKCSKCEKAAVVIEEKIYYCGDCYIKVKRIPTNDSST